jgi:hypothetical protein
MLNISQSGFAVVKRKNGALRALAALISEGSPLPSRTIYITKGFPIFLVTMGQSAFPHE